MAISSLEIFDEGQYSGFWKKNTFDSQGNGGDGIIRVVSVVDMVTKVLNAVGTQRERVELYLHGVGNINYQSVGAGAIRDPSKERSLQVDNAGKLNDAGKIHLSRLRGRVGAIHLLGVAQPGSNVNYPLLLAVAEVLINVQIYTQIGTLVVNYGKPEIRPSTLRTDAERQRLRNELGKLDKK